MPSSAAAPQAAPMMITVLSSSSDELEEVLVVADVGGGVSSVLKVFGGVVLVSLSRTFPRESGQPWYATPVEKSLFIRSERSSVK